MSNLPLQCLIAIIAFKLITFIITMITTSSLSVSMPLNSTTVELLTEEDEQRHLLHNCSQPQPRAICNFQAEIGASNSNQSFTPNCVIVHRCGQAGCCRRDGHKCEPSDAHNVTLQFIRSSTHKTLQQLTFSNHTACECR